MGKNEEYLYSIVKQLIGIKDSISEVNDSINGLLEDKDRKLLESSRERLNGIRRGSGSFNECLNCINTTILYVMDVMVNEGYEESMGVKGVKQISESTKGEDE